ncbi:MAG: hypothetical protein ACI9DO_000477, partial [Reinekea sp.]
DTPSRKKNARHLVVCNNKRVNTMVYSKALIDLISAARRRVPSKDKANIKLANPDMFKELIRIYHASNDSVLKALIKETCQLAGEGWFDKLIHASDTITDNDQDKYTIKVYRGISQVIKAIPEKQSKPKTGPKKIYRGQVVAD